MTVERPDFVIVRHGNTFAAGEIPRRIGWRTNLPLTEAGALQADALGEHFAALGWQFSRVLVSPLLRTSQTARQILRYQVDPPLPEACEWLREIDHGPDEDQTEAAVLARIGRPAVAAWDEQGQAPPGWSVDAEARCAAWRALFAERVAGQTLIVTSNGAARFALLADAMLTAQARQRGGLKLATGSYGVVTRSADGDLQVPVWGQRP